MPVHYTASALLDLTADVLIIGGGLADPHWMARVLDTTFRLGTSNQRGAQILIQGMLMAIHRPLLHRLLFGALLTVSLGQNLQAAKLQPLSVANQKPSIKVLLHVSGDLKSVPNALKHPSSALSQ